LFTDWQWSAYYQYGINKYENIIPRNAITSRNGSVALGNMFMAGDAVFAADGSIVCRSTLTNPNNGCVPLNIFGIGTASDAAIDYIYGEQWTTVEYDQHVLETVIQGKPFSTWAGPVSMAFGIGYREESAVQEADPLSIEGAFILGNPKPFSGRDSVQEAFIEAAIPLIGNDELTHRLELALAGRTTDYSSSGRVETWKAGMMYSMLDQQLRLRATRSHDIRAPSLDERFLGAQQFITTVIDPFTTPPSVVTPWRINVGNPTVAPEIADSWAAGIIMQPAWIPGFSASIDYYDIEIKDALAQISPQRTVDDCFAGNTARCSLLRRDVNGLLIEIVQPFLNISSLRARGYDFETSYQATLGRGTLAARALVTKVLEFEESDGVTTTVSLGEASQPDVDCVSDRSLLWRWPPE
jgi:outer membrane receptor protein involved in Fe transport